MAKAVIEERQRFVRDMHDGVGGQLLLPLMRVRMGKVGLSEAAMFGCAILLSGCQSYGERVIARAQRLDTCGAKPLREYVGRVADQPTREAIQLRVPNAQEIRWISPGYGILANLSTGRINISLNEDGTIQHLGCY